MSAFVLLILGTVLSAVSIFIALLPVELLSVLRILVVLLVLVSLLILRTARVQRQFAL